MKVTFDLSPAGIDRAITATVEYQKWLLSCSRKLLDRLTEKGLNVASARFDSAVYDGTNDISVSVDNRGENLRAVVAVGASALFIEFGTGVVYPDNHPEASSHGMIRGGYGKGKGKQRSWGYYGEPGTNGREVVKPNGQTVVITKGNPANMCMYSTVKDLERDLVSMVREVFK